MEQVEAKLKRDRSNERTATYMYEEAKVEHFVGTRRVRVNLLVRVYPQIPQTKATYIKGLEYVKLEERESRSIHHPKPIMYIAYFPLFPAPYFWKIYKFPRSFVQFTVSCFIYVHPSILTMMSLRIMISMYWTLWSGTMKRRDRVGRHSERNRKQGTSREEFTLRSCTGACHPNKPQITEEQSIELHVALEAATCMKR